MAKQQAIARVVARPLLASMVALVTSELAQVTWSVMTRVLASESVAVATNCCVRPAATPGLAGVIVIAVMVAADTVSTWVPVTEPQVAVMVVVPVATGVARPVFKPMVALPVLLLVQFTDVVITAVVPSV